jgi:hypothetical protein
MARLRCDVWDGDFRELIIFGQLDNDDDAKHGFQVELRRRE